MKKTTVLAPANIAFIKYWGKKDDASRLPSNASFSMNLSAAHTTTTIEFLPELRSDDISIVDEMFSDVEKQKISKHLNRIRDMAKISFFAKVITKNSFPKGTGIASSASGFAALTVAASSSVGLSLSEKELTILARLGSGSACRSIPDGFVLWQTGDSSEESYAYSLCPHGYWDIVDILAVVDTHMKKIATSAGMKGASTSPLFYHRVAATPEKINAMQTALKEKNFTRFGEILEEDGLNMHEVMQTQTPPLFYWSETTKRIMKTVASWRKEGLPVYFTIDAGPNVHIICESRDETEVASRVKNIPGVLQVIINKPAPGAHIIEDHLF